MTDNEIIKALECCTNDDNEPNCKECTKRPHIYCICELLEDAYGLNQRQQERIERLKDNLDAVLKERTDHTEAIEKFAEKIVEQLEEERNKGFFDDKYGIYRCSIDLVKAISIVKGVQNE